MKMSERGSLFPLLHLLKQGGGPVSAYEELETMNRWQESLQMNI